MKLSFYALQNKEQWDRGNAGIGKPRGDSYIIKRVSEISKIKEEDVEMVYRLIFKVIKDIAIKELKNITIKGFGQFCIRKVNEKTAITGTGIKKKRKVVDENDPFKSGTKIIIPAKVRFVFRPDVQVLKKVWVSGIDKNLCPPAVRLLASDRSVAIPTDVRKFS